MEGVDEMSQSWFKFSLEPVLCSVYFWCRPLRKLGDLTHFPPEISRGGA